MYYIYLYLYLFEFDMLLLYPKTRLKFELALSRRK